MKAGIYARHAVAHYWVIDAHARETHVHGAPSETGYGRVDRAPADAPPRSPFAPEIVVRLAAFDRDDLR
ncbi:MAG: Uma2 family endonuclease [Caulobacterales bacterium]|nr:Uma2 family endonuclease [Caulobacterales bacterium]